VDLVSLPRAERAVPEFSAGEGLVEVASRAQVLPSVAIPIEKARGRVITQPIVADRDQPPFDRATTDGFAVRLGDRDRWVNVVGETLPGTSPSRELGAGEAILVTTGACCPPGTEAVVPNSAVALSMNSILLPRIILEGQNVVRRGRERLEGDVLAPSGTIVSPLVIAVGATVGMSHFEVVRRPNIRVLSTGAEVRSSLDDVDGSTIRDANGPMLMGMLDGLVDVPPRMSVVGDDLDVVQDALRDALAADVVIVSGGMSETRSDSVQAALEAIGAHVHIRGIRDEPGERFLFATVGGTLIFALPGHPVAAHRCAHRFVVPAVRKLMGLSPDHLEGEGILTADLCATHPRLEAARVERRREGFRLCPLAESWRPDLYTPMAANVYVHVSEDAAQPRTGDRVRFQWMAPGP